MFKGYTEVAYLELQIRVVVWHKVLYVGRSDDNWHCPCHQALPELLRHIVLLFGNFNAHDLHEQAGVTLGR